MPLNVVLELSDTDLKYFSRVLDTVWKEHAHIPEKELIAGARELLKQAKKAKPPTYVAKQFEEIKLLIDLLADKEWGVEAEDRRRIVAAISYFSAKKDLIPDNPGIGYLDDALVADLVIRELKHDMEGYRDFAAFRENEQKVRGKSVDREDWIAAKRAGLMERVRRRRERMWERRQQKGLTHPILRFKYRG
jgi:uncharacterized membrane protein YkvA (DUF1232 family)